MPYVTMLLGIRVKSGTIVLERPRPETLQNFFETRKQEKQIFMFCRPVLFKAGCDKNPFLSMHRNSSKCCSSGPWSPLLLVTFCIVVIWPVKISYGISSPDLL